MRALAIVGALLACIALIDCGGARGPLVLPTTSERFFVAGYHPYWAGDAWTGYPWDALTELYFFEVEVAGDGTLGDAHGWPAAWLPVLSRALDEGVQVALTVSMHDAEAFERLFPDPVAVDRLVDEILRLLTATPELSGIHVDIEVFQPVALAARDGFTTFVARLAERMDAVDSRLSLSVFTLAFDDDDAYDERTLAELATYVVVQGYDYHSLAEPNAGPLAAVDGWGRLNWTHVVDRFEALGVPARKIVMAVPMYGYEWPTVSEEAGAATRGVGLAAPLTAPPDLLPELPRARDQAERHGTLRDDMSGSPYYVFRDAEGWRQGWFEDAGSLAAKYELVRRRGLGGVAIFPLAYGDEEHWAALRAAFSGTR